MFFQAICFSSIYLIYSYVPETHLKEVPQVQRDLYERFQHSPIAIIFHFICRSFTYCNCRNKWNLNCFSSSSSSCSSGFFYFCGYFSRRFNKGYKYTENIPLEINLQHNNKKSLEKLYMREERNDENSDIQLVPISKCSSNDNSTFNANDACILGLGFQSISEDSEDSNILHDNSNFEVIHL